MNATGAAPRQGPRQGIVPAVTRHPVLGTVVDTGQAVVCTAYAPPLPLLETGRRGSNPNPPLPPDGTCVLGTGRRVPREPTPTLEAGTPPPHLTGEA